MHTTLVLLVTALACALGALAAPLPYPYPAPHTVLPRAPRPPLTLTASEPQPLGSSISFDRLRPALPGFTTDWERNGYPGGSAGPSPAAQGETLAQTEARMGAKIEGMTNTELGKYMGDLVRDYPPTILKFFSVTRF